MQWVTRFATWGVREHIPLDVEKLFHPDTVERFAYAAQASYAVNSVAAARYLLRTVGRAVTRSAPWVEAPLSIRTPGIPAPYTRAEVAQLWGDVPGQSTPLRRHAFEVLLLLGLGAGLRAPEMFDVTATDVSEEAGIVFVDVRCGTPRRVPIGVTYGEKLINVAHGTPAGDYLVPGKARGRNRANYTTSGLRTGDRTPALNLSRLRSTWFHAQLCGLHMPELLAAAGLVKTNAIFDLLDYLPPNAAAARLIAEAV